MSLTFSVDEKYAWVVLVGVSIVWLTMWQAYSVAGYRKRAKIAYPQLYAEKAEAAASPDAYKFNCAQRAHQHTLETVSQTFFLLTFAGLRHPVAAASLGGLWVAGRILYTLDYRTGDPAKRVRGAIIGYAGQWGLQLVATYTAGRLALASLDYI